MKPRNIASILLISFCAASGVPAISFAETDAREMALQNSTAASKLAEAFKSLTEDERIYVQQNLADYGYYSGAVDGLWGKETEAALFSSLEGKFFPSADISDQQQANLYLKQLVEMTNEGSDGAECEDCSAGEVSQPAKESPAPTAVTTAEAQPTKGIGASSDVSKTTTQPVEGSNTSDEIVVQDTPIAKKPTGTSGMSNADFFRSLNVHCAQLPRTDFAGQQADSWASLGGDRSLMLNMQDIGDSFYGGDETAFVTLKRLLTDHPEFPPLQFMVGYGYWQHSDFENAMTWLSRAAGHGEPNASYLIALVALNYISTDDTFKLDASFGSRAFSVSLAKQCLEVVLNTDPLLPVVGGLHQSYFIDPATALLAPIYLRSTQLLYTDAPTIFADWTGIPAEPENALSLFSAYSGRPTDSCDSACWEKIKSEADRQIAEAQLKEQDEAESKRSSSAYASAEFDEVMKKCDGYTTIKSLCWGQTREEMVRVLATKGFPCQDVKDVFGMSNTECKNNGSTITLSDDSISYNCSVFNTCGFTLDEVAKMMIDQGVVPDLTYNDRTWGDGVSSLEVEEYCGRGPKLEKICVTKLTGFSYTEVKLSKGASANGAPSFQ